jgi:hypothetical protein
MGSITSPRVDEVVAHILPALRTVFGVHLRAAIVKGSVIKGDFIPFYSDLDIHVFLESAALLDGATPRADSASNLRRPGARAVHRQRQGEAR